jgi:hypothetical protein
VFQITIFAVVEDRGGYSALLGFLYLEPDVEL